MKIKFFLTALLCTIILVSCGQNGRNSAVMNEKITATNLDDIAKKIIADKSMDSKDLELFLNGIARLGNVKDSLVGKTVKDVIVWQEDFIKKNEYATLSNLANTVIVKMNSINRYLGMTPVDNNGQKINVLYFIFENRLNKPIKAFSGEVTFFYQDEQTKQPIQLKPFPFDYSIEIPANSKDTIQLNQNHIDTDQLSNLIRERPKNISGFLNITNVSFTDTKAESK